MTEFCPECKKRDDVIHDLKDAYKEEIRGLESKYADMITKFSDPNHQEKCSGGDCPVSKVHKQIEDRGFRRGEDSGLGKGETQGFDKGKASIGLDEVKAFLKAKGYIEPIREIVVQTGKK